jgi:rod shape-determining protein MreD
MELVIRQAITRLRGAVCHLMRGSVKLVQMRLVAFYLLLLVTQGLLSAVMAPLPAPDLFLVAVLSLLWRLNAWQLVLAAYGIGLVQDLTGHGTVGLHALGLAGAAMTASFVRAQLSQSGFMERLLTILAGLSGKWVVMAGMLVWMSGDWSSLSSLPAPLLFDSVFTLVLGSWLLGWVQVLQSRNRSLGREIL